MSESIAVQINTILNQNVVEDLKKSLAKRKCLKISNMIFIFIIPFLASLYCLAQLVYRGLSGIVVAMDTSDMQHANKMKMVFGYLVFFIILYTLWPVFLYITMPNLIKSFATKEYLDLYYKKLKT